jgi:DNA-binding NtrC family response regulator
VKPSDFTILFADDNPSVKLLYEKAFTQEGFKVLTCDNAAQIIAELKEEKVDLLVTDLEMPAANTLELFPILKRDHPRLPVIIVSGHYKDLQVDFLSRGYNVSAFLNKPIGLSVLKDKVKEVLKIGEK